MELTWKAIYSNGKSLNQYNVDGSVNKYIDIDRSLLKYFELYQKIEKKSYTIQLEIEKSFSSSKVIGKEAISYKVVEEPRKHEKTKLILRIHLGDDKKLIFRRRVSLNISSTSRKNTEIIYLVGWQKNVNGKNVQSICYIFEDGHIEIAGQWKEDSEWFYAPNLIKEEK